MYKVGRLSKTHMRVNDSETGEPIENKVRRILNNKEPIKDGAPIIYTERRDGVQPQFNIRTDRFEIAVEAMDKVHKSKLAHREERHKPKTIGEEAKENMKKEEYLSNKTKYDPKDQHLIQ